MPRGGSREGAGRPPRYEGPKEQKSVSLSPRAWAFLEMQALQRGLKEGAVSEVLEQLIRAHPMFRPEQGGNNVTGE